MRKTQCSCFRACRHKQIIGVAQPAPMSLSPKRTNFVSLDQKYAVKFTGDTTLRQDDVFFGVRDDDVRKFINHVRRSHTRHMLGPITLLKPPAHLRTYVETQSRRTNIIKN